MEGFRVADRSSLALSSLLIAAILVWAAITAITSPEGRTRQNIAPRPVTHPRPNAPDAERMLRIALPPPPAASAASPRPSTAGDTIVNPIKPVSPLRPKTRPAVAPPVQPIRKALAPIPRTKPTPRSLAESPKKGSADGAPADTASAATADSVVTARSDDRPGRALLRLLEHGSGPSIEIAWPARRDARERLFRRLTACYGMRAAIMDESERLFADGGPPQSPWKLNADRYSGFLRVPQGKTVAEEGRAFARIAEFHRLANWRPVRVFPRAVDAALLGGLERLIGARYRKARTITGAYELQRDGLLLTRIVVDGHLVAGGVRLAARNCR